MNRRFLNLVVKNLDSGLYSLRRLNLSSHLFYPSAAAAETAMARTEEAIKANAESQAGYKHGLRFLQTMATSLGSLPAAMINFKASGPSSPCDVPLDFVSVLGDESLILCSDSAGRTSLYDADSHSVLTVPDLRAYKGRDSIPFSIACADENHAADDGCYPDQGGSLYVLSRAPDLYRRDCCFEVLGFDGGEDVFNPEQLFRGWYPLPPPPLVYNPAYKLHAGIDAYTVVGGSTICISSTAPGIGTYCFDTTSWKWSHAGNWRLPFCGKAEYVPELNLWFGLSATHPFHLCASDLSRVEFEQPPAVLDTWVDLDMPKSWSPFQLDLIHLGAGRFCVVKIFPSTSPPIDVGFSDQEDDDDEAVDYRDLVHWEFAVLTGIEVVHCDGEAHPGKLRMIKHKSIFHTFSDDVIRWVL